MLNRYSFEDTIKSKEDLLKWIFKTLEPVLITLFTLSNRIIHCSSVPEFEHISHTN